MAKYIPLEEPKAPETGLGSAVRNIAGIGSRVAEAALGLPGDIQAGIKGLTSTGLSYLGIPQETTQQAFEMFTPAQLPTSQGLRENAPEYLQPQSQTAETVGDIAQTLTRALLPPFGATSLSSVPGILGRTILGESAAQGIKSLGGGTFAQEAGRVGSIFLSSLFGAKYQANKAMNSAYDNAGKSLEGKTLSPALKDSLETDNTKFFDKISRTVSSEKKFLKDTSQTIDQILTEPGGPSVKELWDAKRAINDKLSEWKIGSSEYNLGSQLVRDINKTLRNYGSEFNQDFLKNFNVGEEIYKGLQPANAVSKFLTENVNLKSLFRKPLYKLIAFSVSPTKFAAGASIAALLKESTQLYDLLSRSPEARKITGNLLSAALKQNSKEVIKNTLKLEKAYNKGQKRYTIIAQ